MICLSDIVQPCPYLSVIMFTFVFPSTQEDDWDVLADILKAGNPSAVFSGGIKIVIAYHLSIIC